MQKNSFIANNLEKFIARVAKISASKEANTACTWFAYQP